MASEQSRLLTRDEFIAARDKFALDRMLERGEKLWTLADAKLKEARTLRKKLQAAPKWQRHAIEEEYTKTITAWAAMETEIGDIQRDQRYTEWRKTQKIAETA